MNTKGFAYTLFNLLKNDNFKPAIIFGDMTPEEREEIVARFRKLELKVLITTNILARGIDVPEIQIVINFDVPTQRVGQEVRGDAENYMHRIGRTGRFGSKGIAVSIYDRDCDKEYLTQIMDEYSMGEKLGVLAGKEHLQTLFNELNAEV